MIWTPLQPTPIAGHFLPIRHDY